MELEVLGMFERRYKQELKEVGGKIQRLMGEGLELKSVVWNERC